MGNAILVSFVFLADLNAKFPGAYSSANLVIILISKELGMVSASRFTIRMLVCELTEASMNLFVSITVTHLGLSNFSETCY